MFISQKGLDLIKEFEGCILRSYDDYNNKIINAGESYTGTLTIGYGHIEGVYAGQEISQEQANKMLVDDMFKYCRQVHEVINEGTITFPVSQNMFDALVSFEYNLGQGCLRTLCKNRDKTTVADKMLLYINPGSVWEQGLLRRRKAERELFLSDAVSSPTSVEPSEPTEWNGYNMNRVRQLQSLLNGLGITTLDIDGKFGTNSQTAAKNLPLAKYDGYHNDAYTDFICHMLGIGTPEGYMYNRYVEGKVREFQAYHGLSQDGVVGFNTLCQLLK